MYVRLVNPSPPPIFPLSKIGQADITPGVGRDLTMPPWAHTQPVLGAQASGYADTYGTASVSFRGELFIAGIVGTLGGIFPSSSMAGPGHLNM